MELQPDNAPKTLAGSPSSTPPLTTPSSTTSSIPTLRFPRPQGSQQLAHWISTSSPDIRRPPSMADLGNLADSAYEIINGTDSESQDGQLSESTGSLSVSRPDDVHSLDGSEQPYDSESDDEPANSSHASIQYADEALQSPSTHISTHTLRYSTSPPLPTGSTTVHGSIEFREDDSLDPDKISVNHVVREFTEEESAVMLGQLDDVPLPPRRLVATVRQTMSQAYLSTKDPLRVLYVGRAGAMRGIVIKVSNAIWASPNSAASNESPLGKQREGVYNIVPIASFGDAPELDLMEASHCQIKVEHCTSAFEYNQRDRDAGSPLYDITIDHDREKIYGCYRAPGGTFVSPQWTPPHVAIFFCADDEDEDEKQTRKAASKFLKEHGVPSIVISESSLIEESDKEEWARYIDEHSVHLCLESRDPERPIAPRRFPIDLPSFTNIDARQMNRNLAMLTGVLETPEKADTLTGSAKSFPLGAALGKAWRQRPSRDELLQSIETNKWFVALVVPVIMALLAPFLAALLSGSRAGGAASVQQGAISDILEELTSTTCVGRSSTTTGSVATSTSTIVINVTSTKTVQIVRAMPSTSTVASALSFAGFLSDKPSGAPAEPKLAKTTCSVEKHSPNELLIKIPSDTKTSWLAKEAITVDVHRGEQRLKTKLSVIDEGMLVELEQGDAYGPLNVSVVTTRRPKINETFEVDFGKPITAEILDYGRRVWHEIAERAPAYVVTAELKSKVLEVRDVAVDRVHKLVTPEVRNMVRQSQIFLKKHWIGLRSKEEMEQYERKAKKAEALRKGRGIETKVGQASSFVERVRINLEQSRSGFWMKGNVKPDQADSKDSGWRKIIAG
ncbi:hypothetical protein OQA88_532 [Cercophora sp. LCS_1]